MCCGGLRNNTLLSLIRKRCNFWRERVLPTAVLCTTLVFLENLFVWSLFQLRCRCSTSWLVFCCPCVGPCTSCWGALFVELPQYKDRWVPSKKVTTCVIPCFLLTVLCTGCSEAFPALTTPYLPPPEAQAAV